VDYNIHITPKRMKEVNKEGQKPLVPDPNLTLVGPQLRARLNSKPRRAPTLIKQNEMSYWSRVISMQLQRPMS
jgi:hypothetical protein